MFKRSLILLPVIALVSIGPAYGQNGWDPQNSGTNAYLTGVFFTDPDTGWVVGIRNTILHTTDGGDNWRAQNPPPSVNYYGVHFTDAQTGWAVGSSGEIRHTTDGGANWVPQNSGTSYNLWGVFFTDSNTGWIVGGKERTYTPPTRFILHTEDGGDTWQTQFYQYDEVPLQGVYFLDSNTGWAVGDGGAIFHTIDGGDSWNEQTSGTPYHLRDIHFTDANNGWTVGVQGTRLYTTDAGSTWIPQETGTDEGFSSVHFADVNTGWIVGGDNSVGRILHTTDAGASWYAQNSGTTDFLAGAHFVGFETGWAVGLNGTIVHTTTGGGTMPTVSIEIVPDNPPVVVPQGGFFGFTGHLTNNTEQSQSVDVWVMVDLQGQGMYGPLRQINNVTLSPMENLSGHFDQQVPGSAPLGVHTYIAYCGDHPATILDSSYFEVEIIPSALAKTVGDIWTLEGGFGRGDYTATIPSGFALLGNYPNPFNAATTITYQLPSASRAKLEIYNLLGEKLITLVDENQEAGYASVNWDASQASSGVYFYKLTAGDYSETRGMMLVK